MPKKHVYGRVHEIDRAAYCVMRMTTDPVARAVNPTQNNLQAAVEKAYLRMVGVQQDEMNKKRAFENKAYARQYISYQVLQKLAMPSTSGKIADQVESGIREFASTAAEKFGDEGLREQPDALRGMYEQMIQDQLARARSNLGDDFAKYGGALDPNLGARWEGGYLISNSANTRDNGREMARYIIAQNPEADHFVYEIGYAARTTWAARPSYNQKKAEGFLEECLRQGKMADLRIDLSRDDRKVKMHNISDDLRKHIRGKNDFLKDPRQWANNGRVTYSQGLYELTILSDLHAESVKAHGDTVEAWAATLTGVYTKYQDKYPSLYKNLTKRLMKAMPGDMAAMLLGANTDPDSLAAHGIKSPDAVPNAAEPEMKTDDVKAVEGEAKADEEVDEAENAQTLDEERQRSAEAKETPAEASPTPIEPKSTTPATPPSDAKIGYGDSQPGSFTKEEAEQTSRALAAMILLAKPSNHLQFDASKNPPITADNARDQQIVEQAMKCMRNANSIEEFEAYAMVVARWIHRARAQTVTKGGVASKAMRNFSRKHFGTGKGAKAKGAESWLQGEYKQATARYRRDKVNNNQKWQEMKLKFKSIISNGMQNDVSNKNRPTKPEGNSNDRKHSITLS